MRRVNTDTIAIIISVVIFGLTIFFSLMYRNKKIKSGKMANHKGRFYTETHTYTTRAAFPAFYNALSSLNLAQDKINAQWDGVSNQMFFNAPGWNAQLVQLQTAAGMPNQFAFDFTGWQSTNGVPSGGIKMNMLLTAIDKAFLMTDLDATVIRQPKKVNVKNTFF